MNPTHPDTPQPNALLPMEELDMRLNNDAKHLSNSLIDALRRDENAFTSQVMAALLPTRMIVLAPTRTYNLSVAQRAGLVCTPTALAAAIVATTGKSGEFLVDAAMDIATATITPNVIGLATLITVCVLGTIIGVLRSR